MRSIAALAAIFVLSVAASCGGGMMTAMEEQPAGGSSIADESFANLLPQPAGIGRGISETSEQRWRFGKDYLPDFTSGENVAVQLENALLQPVYNAEQGVAWAGYRFWLPDYGNEHSVQVGISGVGEPTPGTLYLGLANWDSNRWDFFSVPEDGAVSTGELGEYIRYGDDLLYAVMLTDGQADTAISMLRIGGELELTARLTSDMAIGLAPTAITLDGSDSLAYGGDIMQYEFDPEGDGNWIDNGADSDLVHFYLNPGYYMAGLRVTDDLDQQSTAYLPIVVQGGAYDELEDNDEVEQAQQLQAAPMAGFTGNFGNDGVHGDDMDIFSFELEQSASVDISVNLSDFGARLSLYRSFDNGNDIEPLVLTDLKGLNKGINESLAPGLYYIVIDNPMGGEGVDLDYTLSIDMSMSEAPVVVISDYEMEIGSNELFNFSINDSYDPDGTIAVWSVDLNGDGHFEATSGATGNFLFDAPKRPGHFMGTAKVVDNTGIAVTKQFEIVITGEAEYNHIEMEPNGEYGETNDMPLFSFGKLYGDLGGDINGPDMQDYYSFTTEFSGNIEIELDVVDELTGELTLYLTRWNGAEWEFVEKLDTGMDGVLSTGPFSPAGDYTLIVTAEEGGSRYYLGGEHFPDF